MSRIELGEIPRGEAERVLRAMGAEIANVHVASNVSESILNDLNDRPVHWLEEAARVLSENVEQDWMAWGSTRQELT
jgi:hypothetical protein